MFTRSFLILVILATAVTATPTKGDQAELKCKNGTQTSGIQPTTENSSLSKKDKHDSTVTISKSKLLRDALAGLTGGVGLHLTLAQEAKRAFQVKYKETTLPSNMLLPNLTGFEVIKQIWTRSLGEVHEVLELSTSIKYARKTLEETEQNKEQIKNEKMLLYAVDSQYISKLRYYIKDGCKIHFFMDYVPGEFVDYTIGNSGREEEVRDSMANVVLMLEYLHSVGCIHHYVSLKNIMIDTNTSHCMLINLGFAKVMLDNPDEEQSNKVVGPAVYWAPELVKKEPYNELIDSWALGVVLYATVYKKFPFTGNGDAEVVNLIKAYRAGNLNFPKEFYVSEDFKDLIENLLTADLGKRYSMHKIKEHAWFRPYFNRNEGTAQTATQPIPSE